MIEGWIWRPPGEELTTDGTYTVALLSFQLSPMSLRRAHLALCGLPEGFRQEMRFYARARIRSPPMSAQALVLNFSRNKRHFLEAKVLRDSEDSKGTSGSRSGSHLLQMIVWPVLTPGGDTGNLRTPPR